MLALEGISVALILCWPASCCSVTACRWTMPSFRCTARTVKLGLGVVIAIFSLVGFESATAFGEETKQPLKTIPRAVIWSLLATGLFFIVVSYMEVYGLRNYKTTLDQLAAPLNDLADLNGIGWIKIPVSLGAMAPLLLAGAVLHERRGADFVSDGPPRRFPPRGRRSHDTHKTPHVAVSVMAGADVRHCRPASTASTARCWTCLAGPALTARSAFCSRTFLSRSPRRFT